MSQRSWTSPRLLLALYFVTATMLAAVIPTLALADVEGSLRNMRSELTGVILPLLSVMGLGIASISFFTGNIQAKQHIIYAILGCCFGFGAQQIADFIASMVH